MQIFLKDIKQKKRRQSGVTFFEILEVFIIIGLLLGLLLPAIGRVRSRARSTVCLTQIRQLALAVRTYADDFGGTFPTTLYGSTIRAYYTNPAAIVLCPEDSRDLSTGSPRGSYGLNAGISSYKLTTLPEVNALSKKPIVILGDSRDEGLTVSSFNTRHRGKGNIAFLDGHTDSVPAANLGDYF